MRDVIFANEHFYHIYNRGVDKRDIFMDDADRWRFIKSLCIFNDSIRWSERSITFEKSKLARPEKPFVKIHAFCLMTNHFHLLIEQVIDGGVAKFMHRLGIGYTTYFNKRYERTGSLLGGTFKAKIVNDDGYLSHLSRYIHLNPINNIIPINELSEYRWSSYNDYIGRRSFPFIETKFIMDGYKNTNDYIKFIKSGEPAINDQISHLYYDESQD